MNVTLSNSYVLKYKLKDTSYYWTKQGECFNMKTGRIIKKTLVGSSIGFCINGKFKSVNTLRRNLEKVEKEYCPF